MRIISHSIRFEALYLVSKQNFCVGLLWARCFVYIVFWLQVEQPTSSNPLSQVASQLRILHGQHVRSSTWECTRLVCASELYGNVWPLRQEAELAHRHTDPCSNPRICLAFLFTYSTVCIYKEIHFGDLQQVAPRGPGASGFKH